MDVMELHNQCTKYSFLTSTGFAIPSIFESYQTRVIALAIAGIKPLQLIQFEGLQWSHTLFSSSDRAAFVY